MKLSVDAAVTPVENCPCTASLRHGSDDWKNRITSRYNPHAFAVHTLSVPTAWAAQGLDNRRPETSAQRQS